MLQPVKFVSLGLISVMLFGCAAPLSLSMKPDLGSVQADGITSIDKHVGYHISDVNKALRVTTAAGGANLVSYYPYRDIEVGFYKALTKAFRGVSRVKNPSDLNEIRTLGISLLVVPEIKTASSSSGPLTPQPTSFTVNLICTITDSTGQPVRRLTVTGNGTAHFSEFKGDVFRVGVHATNEEIPNSLAAVRATNDALSKLITALSEAPELRK